MRVGVIRGDVPGPINEPGRLFLADLEPTSQFNPPTEPFGQTRYVSRPDPVALADYMAGVFPRDISAMDGGIAPDPTSTPPSLVSIPAGKPFAGGVPAAVISTAPIVFPVTLVAGVSDTLAVSNVNPPVYTSAVIGGGAGLVAATMAALLTAVNAALAPTGKATAVSDSTGTKLIIQSTIPGVASFIELGPATNTAPLFLAAGQLFLMPSAATIITALNPVVIPPATGSINVSAANIVATLGPSPSALQVADFVAPKFIETEVAVQSFQVGNLSEFLELDWNPDPRRLPAITSGPAIQVVQDDGITPFSASALAPLPRIATAVHGAPLAGDITISGVGLGNIEFFNETVVTITQSAASTPPGQQPAKIRVTQQLLNKPVTSGTQGSVSNTTIVIPASLLNAPNGSGGTFALGAAAGSTVEVKYETLANTNYGAAATITAFDPVTGYATVSVLTNQFPSQVGQPLVLSGSVNPGNNGTFPIVAWVSATSVKIANFNAVSPDAGPLVWSEPEPVAFVTT